jgi:hypothetical protein
MSNVNDGPKRPSLESAFEPDQVAILKTLSDAIFELQHRVFALEKLLKAHLDASPQPARPIASD